MHHRLYCHVVWTTRERLPLIDHDRALFLRRYLPSIAREERAAVLALGIVSTHVHVLARVHPACQIARLLQRWKGGSTFVCRRDGVGNAGAPLRWAKGYSVITVGPRALPRAYAYLAAQPRRHPDEAIAPS